MSEHNPGFALTSKAHAYLKCHPTPHATRCGACGRSQRVCTASPCPTRLDFVLDTGEASYD